MGPNGQLGFSGISGSEPEADHAPSSACVPTGIFVLSTGYGPRAACPGVKWHL